MQLLNLVDRILANPLLVALTFVVMAWVCFGLAVATHLIQSRWKRSNKPGASAANTTSATNINQ